MFHVYALMIKSAVAFVLALLVGAGGRQALAAGVTVALLTWWLDRRMAYAVQSWTRWAIEGGVAGLTLWALTWLLALVGPVAGLSGLTFTVYGALVGLAEVGLHRVIRPWAPAR